MVEPIILFGKHLSEKYPLIFNMINYYYNSDIVEEIDKVKKYKSLMKDNKRIRENIEIIKKW